MSGIGVKDLKILHVLSYPSPNFNKSWDEYRNWVANLWNPFNAHSLEVQATPYTNSLPQQKKPMTLILTIPLLFGQPCMIQCQWLIYSNPHNVHIYISGSPRNNIFTHTLNIDNACYASHSTRLFSKPFIVERISGFRIVQYVHNQKLIFKKLFWWCISFALIKKTQKPSAIFM